MANLKAQTRE